MVRNIYLGETLVRVPRIPVLRKSYYAFFICVSSRASLLCHIPRGVNKSLFTKKKRRSTIKINIIITNYNYNATKLNS